MSIIDETILQNVNLSLASTRPLLKPTALYPDRKSKNPDYNPHGSSKDLDLNLYSISCKPTTVYAAFNDDNEICMYMSMHH